MFKLGTYTREEMFMNSWNTVRVRSVLRNMSLKQMTSFKEQFEIFSSAKYFCITSSRLECTRKCLYTSNWIFSASCVALVLVASTFPPDVSSFKQIQLMFEDQILLFFSKGIKFPLFLIFLKKFLLKRYAEIFLLPHWFYLMVAHETKLWPSSLLNWKDRNHTTFTTVH